MCGIAGIVAREAVPIELPQGLARRLRHRGPDDQGIYRTDNVALVQTRLSIIDLEHGHQPIESDDPLVLVANGEVYNYVELNDALKRSGRHFATASDSETILHCYAVAGIEGLTRLNGMYAFAIYDGRRRKLILARDRLGIKPLYYTRTDSRLLFASELKALVPSLQTAPEIEPKGVVEFLQNQFVSGRDTVVRQIKRVLPGEILEIDEHLEITSHRYWSAAAVTPRALGANEAEELFAPLFEQVVREHIRSDVPFGVFLSGGVDSAIVLAMLRRFVPGTLRSYSVGWAGVDMHDETGDAARIAELFGTEHTVLRLTRDQVFARIPHMIWSADELMRDYACLPTSLLAEAAARELKVVFTGEGGDEAFAGYTRYRKSRVERKLRSLYAPGSGGFRTRGQLARSVARALLGTELSAHTTTYRQPFVQAWQATPSAWSDVQRSQFVDLTTALPNNLLVKVDRMLMAFGQEGRVPFLDHRIVEFGLSLPDALKIRSGHGKHFLRRWAARLLPKDHLAHKKRGFHVPAGSWFDAHFVSELEKRLVDNPTIRRWFNVAGIRRVAEEHRRGHSRTRALWCLMQFAIWHKTVIDAPDNQVGTQEDPLDWVS